MEVINKHVTPLQQQHNTSAAAARDSSSNNTGFSSLSATNFN
jgi:hypothetical protein